MLRVSPVVLAWGGRGRKPDMNKVLEGHFWGLTRYRILPMFLGLDYAGNVIFFPSYRTQRFGGWTAVTLGAPGSGSGNLLTSDMSGVNVLEDGYPMHYKASKKLQAYVLEEKKKWTAQKEKEAKKRAEEAAARQEGGGGGEKEGGTPSVGTPADAAAFGYDSEQQFRDMLAIRCSNPKFYSRRLRISPLATFTYKCFYFYLWAVLVSLIVQGYLLFRAWVNPPARAGLKSIEEHVLHVPRLLFAGCVHGLAWLARTCQPIIDPIVQFLQERFPQVNWGVASAESLASKAEHLANDTHPAAEMRKEERRRVELKQEEERRTWWTRILLVLLAIFSVLCVL